MISKSSFGLILLLFFIGCDTSGVNKTPIISFDINIPSKSIIGNGILRNSENIRQKSIGEDYEDHVLFYVEDNGIIDLITTTYPVMSMQILDAKHQLVLFVIPDEEYGARPVLFLVDVESFKAYNLTVLGGAFEVEVSSALDEVIKGKKDKDANIYYIGSDFNACNILYRIKPIGTEYTIQDISLQNEYVMDYKVDSSGNIFYCYRPDRSSIETRAKIITSTGVYHDIIINPEIWGHEDGIVYNNLDDSFYYLSVLDEPVVYYDIYSSNLAWMKITFNDDGIESTVHAVTMNCTGNILWVDLSNTNRLWRVFLFNRGVANNLGIEEIFSPEVAQTGRTRNIIGGVLNNVIVDEYLRQTVVYDIINDDSSVYYCGEIGGAGVIGKIDTLSMEYQNILELTGYTIISMVKNLDGNITFLARDNITLNCVNGVIKNDGTIVSSIKENSLESGLLYIIES